MDPEDTPEPPKRGRGRPKGSLGLKKRLALEEALLIPEDEIPEEINETQEPDPPEAAQEVEPEPEPVEEDEFPAPAPPPSEEEIIEPPPKRKRAKAEPKLKATKPSAKRGSEAPKAPRKPRAPRPEPAAVDAPARMEPLTYTQVLQQFMADSHRVRQSEKRARYESWFS